MDFPTKGISPECRLQKKSAGGECTKVCQEGVVTSLCVHNIRVPGSEQTTNVITPGHSLPIAYSELVANIIQYVYIHFSTTTLKNSKQH